MHIHIRQIPPRSTDRSQRDPRRPHRAFVDDVAGMGGQEAVGFGLCVWVV